MQRLVASRVERERCLGSWSGTGAGKTLAAVLASRVTGSSLTVVCCPNAVVDGWAREVVAIYPDSTVATKTWQPKWQRHDRHKFLILNYEAFQQPLSPNRVRKFVDEEKIDFIIVDEIHYAKQRHVEEMSLRRKHVLALVTLAREKDDGVRVLGMSATPVINNLQEGKGLVELITGFEHDDLGTRSTVSNCMRLHQRLVTLGARWIPDYSRHFGYSEIMPEVDCSEYLDEIRSLGKNSILGLEQILTRARLPEIRRQVGPKTLIYSHYIRRIDTYVSS